jgi:uncharacterized protein (TIGR02594 family)
MIITPFQVAQTWVGTKELPGNENCPAILAMIDSCDHAGKISDEIAWCSAFINFICKQLRLPRSKSLAAKSWLNVGFPVSIHDAQPDSDIVIFNRTANPALGHVGFFAGIDPHKDEANQTLVILGGNQSNSVSLQHYPIDQVAGVRRLY